MFSPKKELPHVSFDYVGDFNRFVMNNTRMSYRIELPRYHYDNKRSPDQLIAEARHEAGRKFIEMAIDNMDYSINFDARRMNDVVTFSVRFLTDPERDELIKSRQEILSLQRAKVNLNDLNEKLQADNIDMQNRLNIYASMTWWGRLKYMFTNKLSDI